MDPIEEYLKRIHFHLTRLDRPAAKLLQAGLTEEAVRRRTVDLPFVLPDEIVTLYMWRNGTLAKEGDILDELHFFPGYYLLSLEDAIRIYGERKDAEQWANPAWFPVLENGAGDFFLSECPDKPSKTAPMIGFMHGEPEQLAEHESLTAMMKTLAECYEEEAVFIDDEGRFELDDSRYEFISRRNSPGL